MVLGSRGLILQIKRRAFMLINASCHECMVSVKHVCSCLRGFEEHGARVSPELEVSLVTVQAVLCW